MPGAFSRSMKIDYHTPCFQPFSSLVCSRTLQHGVPPQKLGGVVGLGAFKGQLSRLAARVPLFIFCFVHVFMSRPSLFCEIPITHQAAQKSLAFVVKAHVRHVSERTVQRKCLGPTRLWLQNWIGAQVASKKIILRDNSNQWAFFFSTAEFLLRWVQQGVAPL